MNNEEKDKSSGVIESIINLGTATTKLTIDQMQNAFQAITRPGEAMEHVKETMNNLSEAMINSTSGHRASSASDPDRVSNDMRGAATGMEHLSSDAPMPRREPSTATGSSAFRMNRRKA
jgi:hypothetical protein